MEEQRSNEGAKEAKVHPYTKANVFSKLFFTWLFPLFYKGYYNNLSEDDLYPSLKRDDATYLGDKLQNEWEKELKTKKDPSLMRALFKVFGCELAWMAVLYFFMELFGRLSQPLILSKLLKYYEPDTAMTINEAYVYSGLFVASPAVVAIGQHNFMLRQMTMGVKIRVATTALIYRKALKLSRSALAETNVGQMVNLISNDVQRFDNAVIHIHNLWLAPLELLLITVLLYFYVGPAGMIGMAFLILFIPFQMWLAKKTSVFRLNTALRTDERIRLMNEIISGIQVIKMYTWEKPFAKLVTQSRRAEMHQIKKTSTIRAAIFSFNLFVNKTAIYLCVTVFVLTGNIVNAQFVYVITSFYFILRTVVSKRFPEGATQTAEAQISIRRLREFLMREEIDDFGSSTDDISAKSKILLENVYVKWKQTSDDYSLQNVSMEVASGELAVVIGPVGSGKTTLLHAILRELPALKGKLQINGSISYASQEPWLFMGSVRQNIIFGQHFDAKKYEEVIKVCALERDLALLPFGDKTIAGDRGVTLSGGQRARINLARAVYKHADIYLLDDPLSAVDTHVGKHIFEQCIQRYLKDKCVVLVTHQLQYLRNCQKIYLMDSGGIEISGSYNDIQTSSADYAKLLVEVNSKPEDEQTNDDVEAKIINNNTDKAGPKANKEGKEVGRVKFGVYQMYFSNGGHWCKAWWILSLFFAAQGLASLSDYYLSWWVNIEAIRKTNEEDNTNNKTLSTLQDLWLTYMTTDITLIVYSCLVMSLIVITLSRSVFFFRFALKASSTLHNNMFDRIVYATMRFFNTNPSGRILNRFSSDMNQVDEALPAIMVDCLQTGLTVLFATLVVTVVNPWMIIPTVVLLALFYLMRTIYISTSRDVKRVESVTKSPIYSHFAASLQGITTIRAFGAQQVLNEEFNKHQNRNSSSLITFIALARSFGFWLDSWCIFYIFLVTMSFLFFKTDTLGGFVGLSLTQSLTLTGMFQFFIRQWSELENKMTCVERVKEYVDIAPEPDSGSKTPPKTWPAQGRIAFKDLSMRYAADEAKVLKNLTFSVKSEEKVGIVGRTGAGKSSIIAALFRLADNEGAIVIDDIDTKTVSLQRLRSSVSIIPQEPVLFSGTLRKNLDPFDEYNDQVLWNALEEVELKEAASDLPGGLESAMSEGGSNFSVGQRQLVCLARAIVRRNKILVLDEATANVDPRTDALIQFTIRRKFADCTVLTIAHRLHTVMDSDRVLVMDAGRVAEFGSPFELLQDEAGVFSGMVERAGRAVADNLTAIAEKNHRAPMEGK